MLGPICLISLQLFKAQLWVLHFGGVKVSVPHVQRGQIQPLSCEQLQCVTCSVEWSAVRADACLDGEPLSKCGGVLCTEQSSGSWTAGALCWKTPDCSRKAGMEQS